MKTAVLAIGFCLLAALPARAQFPAQPASPDSRTLYSSSAGASYIPPAGPTQTSSSAHPAVVRIVAPGKGSVSYGSGTLVYTNEQLGIVVTNWHVINEATGPISVHFPDGFYSLGTVQNVDRDWDLAIIAIRKPNVTPVKIADQPPRQGEMLTIAGYGSGDYRAASGRCTQYVAPGLDFPYEMVEVAVSARQGDSGGPIFNERGELAGVLFGEGHGRTSGSYCGRVRWFLTSVVPRLPAGTALAAAAPLEPPPQRPHEVGSPVNVTSSPSAGVHSTAPIAAMASASRTMGDDSSTSGTWQASSHVTDPVPLASNTPAADGNMPQAVTIGWHDIAGDTLADQVKTVLAGVGILALLLQVIRWMSREQTTA